MPLPAQAANANFTSCLRPWLIPDRWVENTAPANRFNVGDVYNPPSSFGPGSGWSAVDLGAPLTLTQGDPVATMDGNAYYEMGDPSAYTGAITGCAIQSATGDAVAVTAVSGILPAQEALTFSAVSALVVNGPVIVPVALFSPVEYAAAGPTGPASLHIVHMMGFRISSVDADGTLHGTIVTALGEIAPGRPVLESSLGLLKFIMLVR